MSKVAKSNLGYLVNRYSIMMMAAVFLLLFGYAYISTIDLKLAIGFVGAGILFLWMWYDIRIGLWALVFSVLAGQIIRVDIGGGGILLSDGVVGVLSVVWLLNVLYRKKVFRFNLLWLVLVLFWMISLALNIWASANYGGEQIVTIWLYWMRFVLYSMCLPITWSITEWYGEQKRYLKWFLIMGFIFLVLGFVQLKILPDISFLTAFGWDPHQGRLLSTFLDPNFAGAVLILFFSISFSCYFRFKKWDNSKLFWTVLSLLFLAGIIFTLSRSAYVALAAVFAIIAFLFDKRVLVLGGMLGLLFLVNNPRIIERVQGIFSVDETATLRLESWQDSMEIVQDNFWTGVGYNALAYEQVRRGIVENINVHSAGGSDSSYLTVWSTMGIVGLIFFILLISTFFSLAYCIYRKTEDRDYQYFLLGTMIGILGVMIHAQFTNSLFYVHILIPVWFLMGLSMGWGKNKITNYKIRMTNEK